MRDTQALIHLNYLKDNVITLMERVKPSTKFCGVVKADAYGHGAVPVAKALVESGADFLAVALAQEAMELRSAGLTTPILIFTGVYQVEDLKRLIQDQVRLTCYTPQQAELIKNLAESLETKALIHLKVDSGMSRIGVQDLDQAKAVLEALASDYTEVEGIYTHFADGDNMADDSMTHKQFGHFDQVVKGLEEAGYSFDIRHCCNTAAAIRYPEYHLDMVRIGIGLYGYLPDESMAGLVNLKPVMTVQTNISHIKTLKAGRTIGYGASYQMPKDGKIATVSIGYADGVVRSLSNKGSFIYQRRKLPIVGRVCMDQLMLDVSDEPDLTVGQTITWFGPETADTYSLFDICKEADAFHYEVLTRISPRIPRTYLD